MSEFTTAKTVPNSKKAPNKLAQAIGSFFHVYERGTTIRSEIGAGISAFLIACSMFLLNAQIIGKVYGNYAGSYLAVTLVSFIGTLLLGFVCNRPLIQSSNLAISTSIVAMISANAGLTYANMMAITFVSAVISLGLVVSPIGNKISQYIPCSVKKALPVSVGLLTMYQGLEYSGLLSGGSLTTIGSSFSAQSMYLIFMVIATIAYVVLRGFKVKKSAMHIFLCLIGFMWAFGIIFFLPEFVGGQTATTMVYQRLNLIVATDGASPYNIALGFTSVKWAECFTQGFNFSGLIASGGNPALIFIKGIIIYSIMGLASNTANLHAVAASGDFLNDDSTVKEERKTLIIANSLNVVAPLLGAPITSVSPTSAALTNDEGKTGLSSVITSLGFFVCLFTWAFFAIFATKTHGVGMWINESEIKLAAYVQDVLAFNNILVVLVASRMLRGIKSVDAKNIKELAPFVATLAGTIFFKDVALGIMLGILFDSIVSLIQREFDSFKTGKIVMSSISLIYMIFVLI